MFTLADIIKQEKRILVDNSAFGFDRGQSAEQTEETARSLIDIIDGYESVHVLPETIDELHCLKRDIHTAQKKFRRQIQKLQSSQVYSDAKGHYFDLSDKIDSIQGLINCLKDKRLDLDESDKYNQFVRLMLYLQDTFRIKKHPDPNNRTDEKIIAAALFLTAYGSGDTAIVTGDSDLKYLLMSGVTVLTDSKSDLAENLKNRSISLYFRIPETQDYKIALNSKSFHHNTNYLTPSSRRLAEICLGLQAA